MSKLKKIITKINRVLETNQQNHDEIMDSLRRMEGEMDIIQVAFVVFMTTTLVAMFVIATIF